VVQLGLDIIRKHGLEVHNKIFLLSSLWCASCYNVDRLTGLFSLLLSSVDISLSVCYVMY